MTEAQHIPTVDELIELPQLPDAQISPDGRCVAFVMQTPDWKTNAFLSQIWLAWADDDAESPRPARALTFARRSSHTPRWSPDSQWLAFLSKRNGDKAVQIYRMAVDGGEPERLTEMEIDILNLAWSPDGRFLAFSAIEPPTDADRQREETYGDYYVEDEDFHWTHLWLLDVATQKWRRLTDRHDFHVLDFTWSPDGHYLAFTGTPTPSIEHWDNGRIYLLELERLNLNAITPARYMHPRWSPDGTAIACVRHGDVYYEPDRLYRIESETGDLHLIPTTLDEEIALSGWGPAGLYAHAAQGVESHLYHIDPITGDTHQITPTQAEGWVNFEATFSTDFRRAATVMQDAAHIGEITLLYLDDGRTRRLTQLHDKIKTWQLSQPETVRWHSLDGTEIEGVLTKPANFDPNKQYPLLVVIHGGPSWASYRVLLSNYDRRFYPMSLWLAKEALILQPNYRGSLGYGAEFRALNVRHLGIGDYEDVISGVDALIAQGCVDPQRVGVMGWSQGGYISMFIATYSERFRAVSAGAGISNWMTYYVNTDIHPFTRHYLQATPWDDPEVYAKSSPMTYIKQAKTPTLIQHGMNDGRVPLPNAYELYQGLRDVGVEVRLVTYPGMSHGPNKPRQCRQIMQDNLDWFERWIWQKPAEVVAKRPCYVALAGQEQAETAAEIPAIQRYTAVRVQDVYQWARRDGADFRILSGQHGWLEAETAVLPDTQPEVMATAVPDLAGKVAELFRATAWETVVVYTGGVKKRPSVLIAIGCLQVAAGLATNLIIKHQEVNEAGWEYTPNYRLSDNVLVSGVEASAGSEPKCFSEHL